MLQAAPEHVSILQQQRQFLIRLQSIHDTLQLQETRSALSCGEVHSIPPAPAGTTRLLVKSNKV